MKYTIYNYYDKDDSLGPDIKINLNGYVFKIGKNVVIHKTIKVIGSKTKETYIGHDTYIGENVTIEAGSKIGERNIILKNAKIRGETLYESVVDRKGNLMPFDTFLNSIQRCNIPSKDKINIAFTADDYGRNKEANEGIEYYLSKNILNHASLMINRDESSYTAITFIKKNNIQDRIGMHFNITEVNNKYSVNIKNNFGQKINSGKHELFILTSDEKKILKKELQSQIKSFTNNNLRINYFDSHGHVHFKLPVCRIVKKVLIEQKIKHVRIPMHNFGKLPFLKRIYKLFFKNKVTRIYTNSFDHFDYFIRAVDIFKIDESFVGKTVEVMTHPFAYNNRFANRKDIDFTCLIGFIFDNNIFQII